MEEIIDSIERYMKKTDLDVYSGKIMSGAVLKDAVDVFPERGQIEESRDQIRYIIGIRAGLTSLRKCDELTLSILQMRSDLGHLGDISIQDIIYLEQEGSTRNGYSMYIRIGVAGSICFRQKNKKE